MWCPNCKTKSPTLAVGTDELICAKCRGEVVVSVPRPKSKTIHKSSQRRSPVPVAASENPSVSPSTAPKGPKPKKAPATSTKQAIPDVTFSEPSTEQTVASAQAVVKAWSESNRRWRTDQAHLIGGDQAAETAPPSKQTQTVEAVESVTPKEHKPSGFHMILFGLFVFLVGHGLTVWAFLAGHFGAWTIGSFCSVGGIAISIVSVVQAFRSLESRIASTNAMPGEKHVTRKITKRVRRVRKKQS